MALRYLPFMNAKRAKGPREIRSSRHAGAWTPFSGPLSAACVALISSAAVRHVDQAAFEPPEDTSYRAVAMDAAASDLRIDHRPPVGADARADLEVVLPRAALADLAGGGKVGSIAPSFFWFTGGAELPRQVEEELAPALADELRRMQAQLALLVPY